MKKRYFPFFCVLVLALLLTSCSGKDRKTVGTCAGYDVLYEELRYVTLSRRDVMAETYGNTVWDTPESAEAHRAELESAVLRDLTEQYVILSACAEYLPGRTLDDEDIQSAIDKNIQDAIDSYGSKSEYRKFLKESYLTEHLLRFSLGVAELELELSEKLICGTPFESPETFAEWLQDGNAVRVRRILIPASESDPDGSVKAEEIRERLLGGTPAETLLTDEEKTAGLTCSKNPYYMTRGLDTEAVEAEVFALQSSGDVSRAIPTDGGCLLYLREEDAPEILQGQQTVMLERYRNDRMEEVLSVYREKLTVTFNAYGESIDLLKIK